MKKLILGIKGFKVIIFQYSPSNLTQEGGSDEDVVILTSSMSTPDSGCGIMLSCFTS